MMKKYLAVTVFALLVACTLVTTPSSLDLSSYPSYLEPDSAQTFSLNDTSGVRIFQSETVTAKIKYYDSGTVNSIGEARLELVVDSIYIEDPISGEFSVHVKQRHGFLYDGKYVEWYQSKQCKARGQYRRYGIKTGTWEYFDLDGTVERVEEWQHNQLLSTTSR